MSIDERERFSKESLIAFLKRKYTRGVKFYRWHTLSNTRRRDDGTIEHCYLAVGPKIAQDIINGLHNEDVSIADYVFMYGQFWADCNVYRPPWFTVQNHRKERHKLTVNCAKTFVQKINARKQEKARKLKCLTDEEFFNNMRKI